MKAMQGSSAEIYLHGAHLTSWKNNSGQVSLIVSAILLNSDLPEPHFAVLFVGANICQQAGYFQTTQSHQVRARTYFLLAGTNLVLQQNLDVSGSTDTHYFLSLAVQQHQPLQACIHASSPHVRLAMVNSKQLGLLSNTTTDDRAMPNSAMLHVGCPLSVAWHQCMHSGSTLQHAVFKSIALNMQGRCSCLLSPIW